MALGPDNTDAFDNDDGGFDLTQEDATNYVQWLANQGHKRGLAVGLKNGGAILKNVVSDLGFEVIEPCLQYDEWDTFPPFIDAGKPIFEVEYMKNDNEQPSLNSASVQRIWTAPSRGGFSTVLKHISLDESVVVSGTSARHQTSSSNSWNSGSSSSGNGSSGNNSNFDASGVSLARSTSIIALGVMLYSAGVALDDGQIAIVNAAAAAGTECLQTFGRPKIGGATLAIANSPPMRNHSVFSLTFPNAIQSWPSCIPRDNRQTHLPPWTSLVTYAATTSRRCCCTMATLTPSTYSI